MTVEELRRYGREVLQPLEHLDPLNRVEQTILAQEVDLLLCAALSCSFTKLVMMAARPVSEEQVTEFRRMLDRRLSQEPIGYIIGRVGFHGIELRVSPAVLIPRPETEILVEQVIQRFSAEDAAPTLIDIGTGSGAIVLAVVSALRDSFGEGFINRGSFIGVDISPEAIAVAQTNAEMLGLKSLVSFHVGDLASQIDSFPVGQPDVVVANLPYISESETLPQSVQQFEPKLALRGGPLGLELVNQLMEQVRVRIGKGGNLLLEVGSEQYSEIESRARAGGLNTNAFTDLHGVMRVASVTV